MPYCFYCGNFVRNKKCVRCYKLQPGYFRKEEIDGDCGFSERLLTFGIVILVLYFSSGFIIKGLNIILNLLNG